jgi:hypothetical protein
MRRKKFDPKNVDGHYVLVGQTPVIERDLLKWAKWFEDSDRRVALDDLGKGVSVSTVFLGLDHSWKGSGEPMIFETMVFTKTSKHKKEQLGDGVVFARAATWRQAEEMHKLAVAEMRYVRSKAAERVTTNG